MWLQMEPEDGGTRLIWGDGNRPHPKKYLVGTDTLKMAAEKMQRALNSLSAWAKLANPAALPQILKTIADAGYQLHFVLFNAPTDDISSVKAWIAAKYASGDRVLSVTADPDLHVPWGLVFSENPAEIDFGTGTLAQCAAHFWCFKYDLSVGFSDCDLLVGDEPHHMPVQLLSLMDRNEYAHIEQDALARTGYARLMALPVGTAFDVDECDRLINIAASRSTIFHFFGHGRDGKLIVDDDSALEVDPIKFQMMLASLADRASATGRTASSLIFLNACDSLTGQSDYSLRSASARPGVSGVIAPEAEVPRSYAIRFGLSLLSMLVEQGHSVGEALGTMRNDPSWWPLCLLYGCYAPSEYRVTPARSS